MSNDPGPDLEALRPGEFVIARDGRIVLAHRAQFCEDFPLTEIILGAISAARA